MPEFVLLCKEQHRHDGEHEHCLKLKTKGEGEAKHGQHRSVIQRQPKSQQSEGGIDAVTLSPERAVEHDGGEKQHGEKAGKLQVGVFGQPVHKHHCAIGQQHIEGNAQKLYQVQIIYGQVGEKTEKVHIVL